jgi:hypothetical protein
MSYEMNNNSHLVSEVEVPQMREDKMVSLTSRNVSVFPPSGVRIGGSLFTKAKTLQLQSRISTDNTHLQNKWRLLKWRRTRCSTFCRLIFIIIIIIPFFLLFSTTNSSSSYKIIIFITEKT